MRRVPLYILAGGQARRFGSDKARALLDGRPLLLHAAAALAPIASDTVVVADRPRKHDDLGLRTIGDSGRDLGPLDGLCAALGDLGRTEEAGPWLLLASCDLLGVDAAWLRPLLERTEAAGARAIAFRGDRWQPLPALYHLDLLGDAEAALDGGERALWRLLERSTALALPPPAGWPSVRDVNRPTDLDRARRSIGHRQADDDRG